MRGLLVFATCWLALVFAAQAQQGREEAEQLEHLRDQANARQKQLAQQTKITHQQIAELQEKLIDIGSHMVRQNQHSIEVEEHLLLLQQRETRQLEELLSDQVTLNEAMAALQRLQMSPPPPLAVSPGDTLAAARASMLLGATVPKLRQRAENLRISLTALNALRQEIETGRAELTEQIQALSNQQEQLQNLLAKRQTLEKKLRGDERVAASQAQSLANRAINLRQLIQQLEFEALKISPSIKPAAKAPDTALTPRLKPGLDKPIFASPKWYAPPGRFTDSRGQLDFPVQGNIIARYGRSNNPDQSTGMVFRTSRRAQIIAPYDARIAFAGNFRNLGQLLILDVGEGYHIILAGLSDTYVVQEQTVLAGEPLGKMADRRKPAPEFYLEFRKQGQPFDPEPWLKIAMNAG